MQFIGFDCRLWSIELLGHECSLCVWPKQKSTLKRFFSDLKSVQRIRVSHTDSTALSWFHIHMCMRWQFSSNEMEKFIYSFRLSNLCALLCLCVVARNPIGSTLSITYPNLFVNDMFFIWHWTRRTNNFFPLDELSRLPFPHWSQVSECSHNHSLWCERSSLLYVHFRIIATRK